ncbi:MAG: ABC transporter substrate-binding protein [Gammaproteobacteria bacterium]
MIRSLFVLLLLTLVCACTAQPARPSAPTRIVSLSVVTDEILLSLVPRERVVGVSPDAADALNSHVSTLAKGIPAVEREDTDAILSLQPDLVLSSTRTPKEVEDRLRRARVRVARVATPKGVDDIEAGIRLVAEAVQEAEKGEALIAEMARQARELERLPAVGLRALYYTAGGWTAGHQTSIDMVLRYAGLKNAADLEGHRPVSLEWVLKTNPDLILVGAGYREWVGFAASLRRDPRYAPLAAIQRGWVIELPARDLFAISHFTTKASRELRAQMMQHGILEKPERIVSLTLSASEMLLDLVSRERIAALHEIADSSAYSNIRDRIEGIRLIAPEVEQVIALRPDLVIVASYARQEFLHQLQQATLPVVSFTEFQDVEAILGNILLLGDLVGEPERAEQMVRQARQAIQTVRSAIPRGVVPPRVLSLGEAWTVAGKGTGFHSLLSLAGARNLAAEQGIEGFGTISAEQLVLWDPDLIVVGKEPDSGLSLKQSLRSDPALASLRDKRIVEIPSPHFSCVSQYIVAGLREIVGEIYR